MFIQYFANDWGRGDTGYINADQILNFQIIAKSEQGYVLSLEFTGDFPEKRVWISDVDLIRLTGQLPYEPEA